MESKRRRVALQRFSASPLRLGDSAVSEFRRQANRRDAETQRRRKKTQKKVVDFWKLHREQCRFLFVNERRRPKENDAQTTQRKNEHRTRGPPEGRVVSECERVVWALRLSNHAVITSEYAT